MKSVKFILVLSFLFLFSCGDDAATGSDSDELVGSWNVVDAVISLLLTTNSNQVATNPFDITGQINISGAHTGTLIYFLMDDSTNPPSFILTDVAVELSNFLLLIDGTTGGGLLFTNTNNKSFSGTVNYSYNNGTLTITQSTLTDVAGSATVTISGAMSYNQINISANTPTALNVSEDIYGGGGIEGLKTLTFNDDETVTASIIENRITETETSAYTVEGNLMTITDVDDTAVFEYSVTGNTMTLIGNDFDDYCFEFDSQAECFTDTELFLNLSPGSLTAVNIQVEIILNKGASKQRINIGKNYKYFNPKKVITDFKFKINKFGNLPK